MTGSLFPSEPQKCVQIGFNGGAYFEVAATYAWVAEMMAGTKPFQVGLSDGRYAPKGQLRSLLVNPAHVAYVQERQS